MKDFITVLDAIKQAQSVLAAYTESGNQDAKATVSQLLKILDDKEVAGAVNALSPKFEAPSILPGTVGESEDKLHKALPGS